MSSKAQIPYFWWCKDWYLFMVRITGVEQVVNFANSIAEYGLFGREPTRIQGGQLEYFDRVIRPDLDNQRKRISAKNGQR